VERRAPAEIRGVSARVESIDREIVIRRLARERPRSRFLRGSAALLLVLAVYAWFSGEFRLDDVELERRAQNLQRFIGELKPYPLQSRDWDWSTAAQWLADLMQAKGWLAAAMTLAISIAAVALASTAATVLAFLAARSFAAPEPYLPHASEPSIWSRALWSSLVWLTRTGLIFLRSIPEYVWAFLLIAVIGPNPWAAVLALAIHNTGVLGKLNAEVLENLDPESLSSLRALGAQRRQIAFAGILPAVIPRFLLFFFYRWETCLREATVLGILGRALGPVTTLGLHNTERF
jgi:phosphonate transport system permease protein